MHVLYPEIKPYKRHQLKVSDQHELYVDQAAIDHHRDAPHFQDWRASAPNFMAEKPSGVYEVTGVDTRPVGG